MTAVTMVRIYLTEAEHRLKPLLNHLHDVAKVRGVTVFRAISGFGKSGHVYTSSLVDLSLDLPLVVEFFDVPERAAEIINTLSDLVEKDHIITWEATAQLNVENP